MNTQHRSLFKTSMISEHKCRHTLKRSIGKEKLQLPKPHWIQLDWGMPEIKGVVIGQRARKNWQLNPSKQSKLKVSMSESNAHGDEPHKMKSVLSQGRNFQVFNSIYPMAKSTRYPFQSRN